MNRRSEPAEVQLQLRIADARLKEAEWFRMAVALVQAGAPKDEVDAAYKKALAAGSIKTALTGELAVLRSDDGQTE